MKQLIIVAAVLIIGAGGYFVYQNLSVKIPELPIIVPAAASAGPEWVENMKDTFHITATKVELPYIYVEYANMPPSGVNLINKETGITVWRQTLTTTDGYSGSTVITLPKAIANSVNNSGRYVLEAFGPDGYVYATSDSFYVGEKAQNVRPFPVQAIAEPSVAHEGDSVTFSWSAPAAIDCYFYSSSGKGDHFGNSGSESIAIYSRYLPLSMVCTDSKDNVSSADFDLKIVP